MKSSSLLLSLALLGTANQASAIVLVDRGLPSSANVNNPAGASRSNVNWGNIDGFVNGDSFTATGNWIVDSIAIWAVTDFLPAPVLYGRVNNGNFALVSGGAGSTTATHYQPPNLADPCSNGPSGVGYQDLGGTCAPFFTRITFTGLNIALSAGDVFYFAPDATNVDPDNCAVGGDVSGCFYVHATNAALAGPGIPQDQSNNLYISFDLLSLPGDGAPLDCNSGAPAVIDTCDGGWDKSSDINVLVEGRLVTTDIPEPSTIALIAAGLGALAFFRRRS